MLPVSALPPLPVPAAAASPDAAHAALPAAAPDLTDDPDATVETRLWLDEHVWLYGLLHSARNVAPVFRFPDLISACIDTALDRPDGIAHLFTFLGSELVLRPSGTIRRREHVWQPQYRRLLELQRSPANQHPHPRFQLDQFTTACVALCRRDDETGRAVLRQARTNLARRIASRR